MSQHSKQEQRARTLPSSSRAEEETTCGFGQRDIGSNGFFVVKISNGKKKENAHLRSRRGAEQDETREQRKHHRSGSHGGGLEKRLEGERGEKTKRAKKVWRQCSQLFNVIFRNLLFFCGPCFLPLFPRPISAT